VKVLNGHTAPESAFVVEDYPYGFRLRCKIRFWIETATKGTKKGQQRVVSQTTNPKAAGEVWNKPKFSVYHGMAILLLDDQGHVQSDGISLVPWPEHCSRWRNDYYDQFTEEMKKRFDQLEAMSRKYSPQSWAEWDAKHKG
jgi:hypothetical protein